MDPNKALESILLSFHLMHIEPNHCLEHRQEAIEHLQALHAWIANWGFAPNVDALLDSVKQSIEEM